jgi:hypothetical protein
MTISVIININPVYAQIISTVAGGATGHGSYWGDGGPATMAAFGNLGIIVLNTHGDIYISDGTNRIRKVDGLSGIASTVAGTGTAGFSGDGLTATSAQLNFPTAISIDNFGNLYITDANNFRIRRVDVTTGIIKTICGIGVPGYSGDGGPATSAHIYADGYSCWDKFRNMYLGDNRRIRKIDGTGRITTFAGTGLPGATLDAVPATAANINPEGIWTDTSGNIYFSDTTRAIRKITISSGLLTRVGGVGDNTSTPYCGDGGVATSCHIGPLGICVDVGNNVFIADESNSIIEMVDGYGIIHTVAGNGTLTHTGDGGPATAAGVNWPEGVALDGCGNVYIAEFGSRVVRKVTYPPILTTPTISLSGATAYPIGSTVTVTATVGSAGSSYLIHWLNHGIEFTATTGPSVTYTKPPGTDTITARIVPAGWGCWDSTTSSQHIVSTDVTGVSSVNEPWCMVYPNPAHTTLTAATPWKEGTLTIYNTIGQTVLAKQFYKRGIPVNVGNLPAGIYMVKITGAESETVITRFIKQ